MKCAMVEKALPLLVGGDLAAEEAREVASHVEACAECREIHSQLAESLRWLQLAPPPPFADADFAAVRRNVWREIQAGRHRPVWSAARLVFAAGGVLAAVLVAVVSARLAGGRPELPGRPAGTASLQPKIRPSVPSVVTAEAAEAAEPEPAAPVVLSRREPGRSSRPGAAARPVAPAGESQTVQIEFRTANPDVRIIWLVEKGQASRSALPASRNQEVS